MSGAIQDFTAQLAPFIVQHGALSVFIVSIIEEIVVPIPSVVILLAAGFFLIPADSALPQVLLELLYKIVIPGGFGLALGSMFVYALAYLGGEPAIKAWGKWIKVSWADVERFKARFRKNYWDEVTIFSLRAIPIFPHVIVSAACGAIRYPPRNFFIISVLGSMVRSFILGFLGWSLGAAYLAYSDSVTAMASWVSVAVGASMLGALVWWIMRSRRRAKSARS